MSRKKARNSEESRIFFWTFHGLKSSRQSKGSCGSSIRTAITENAEGPLIPYELTPGGLPHTTVIKYIYIARNPKDESVSFWHVTQTQLKMFSRDDSDPWDNFFGDFLAGRASASIYGGWLNHVLGWWAHRDEPNVLFLKYEDLKKEPHKTVQMIYRSVSLSQRNW